MTKLILIDGDILAYSVGFSVEVPAYVCGGRLYSTRKFAEVRAKKTGLEIHKRKNIGSFDQLQLNLKMKMRTIFEDLGTKSYEMFITSNKLEDNFRSSIATLMPYKGNRKDMERPFHYNRIRELLVNGYKAKLVEGQEADDAIGIRQYELASKYNSFEGTYIATIDKDLRMLEGHHYNLNTRNIDYVDAEEGLKNFSGQLLKGDVTDNIPGLSRLLKLKDRKEEADKLSYGRPGYLKRFEEFKVDHNAKECYDYVIGLYESYGFGTSEITEIGQLLWMRREEGQLWEPKT